MPRPTSKEELIQASTVNYIKLWEFINSMNEEELATEFDFSSDNKKEAHWNRDKNLRDVLVHLYEWHQLLLKWVFSNTSGEPSHFLPEPYNWKTYGQMNIEFWKCHQNTSLQHAIQLIQTSHKDVMNLIRTFSDKELFTKKVFDWTGSTTLGSYCVSATASHYDWAMKKLKLHRKKINLQNTLVI